jgi:hypothetical protein
MTLLRLVAKPTAEFAALLLAQKTWRGGNLSNLGWKK